MKLKNTIIQLKISLGGSTTGVSRQKTEITNLNVGQLKLGSLRSKNLKKEWRKTTITQEICITPSSTATHTLWEPDREEREKEAEGIPEEIWWEAFQIWWKAEIYKSKKFN